MASPALLASPTAPIALADAAGLDTPELLAALATQDTGLSTDEVARRRATVGSNALRTHGASAWRTFVRQLDNPLLWLLGGAVVVAAFLGDTTDAALISAIVTASVTLGFVNEYRSARAVAALQDRVAHTVSCVRDGHEHPVDVVDLVPGDLVELRVGDIVPADVRLVEATGLEVDESVLTGESLTLAKQAAPAPAGAGPFDLPSCAFMGTVVAHGTARAVVVTTGTRTVFGTIAAGLGEQQPVTAFQLGLRRFSGLLVKVAGALTILILVINVALGRPLLEALLFSLAIAIGISPQLLPAIVTISLSQGAKRLAARQVLVKRLVSIEDLGNLTVLFTDKTGTLTQGAVAFERALGPTGGPLPDLLLWGLLCNDAAVEDGHAVGGNQLDVALWDAAAASMPDVARYTRVGTVPFDHDRRLASAVVDTPDQGRLVVVKGAPEALLARCVRTDPAAEAALAGLFAAGARVIAVGSRSVPPEATADVALEKDLALLGYLVFADPPKTDARAALDRLTRLGIAVKVITGDNLEVATKVCGDVGLTVTGALDGPALDALDDAALTAAIATTTVFARVSPEQKARIIRLQRAVGVDVGFLGDGVNDAVALHAADVGISVDTATDVAKGAADIVLLSKDLDVLADGVAEGRRTFANIMKYVLMATSSNFGNMFSAAAASLILPFLPMLPSQLLLNNLLYDVGQLALPNDRVDEELLTRPSQWDVGFIRRYMTFFGPISSLFDFATFAVLLLALHSGASQFRTGWFVESLATQSLVILVIRTRRVPFFHSRPGRPLAVAAVTVALVGALLPFTPLAGPLGFTPLPAVFYGVLLALVATYLTLAELGKRRFFRQPAGDRPLAIRRPTHHHHVHRRAARFSQSAPVRPRRP